MTRLQFLWYAKRVLLMQIYNIFGILQYFYDIFSTLLLFQSCLIVLGQDIF